ncbi:TRAP transporter large permease [Desulfovibrio sp. OttesenSCG-928-G15]|nr:TRAP transporter large permease [Desulfovibrio sp. OttesenSCG-928-G15]
MLEDAILSLLILVIMLTLGAPLPFCFGGALMYMSVFTTVSMKGMLMWALQQILSPVLLCVPLFIFAGSLMSESGIARYLLDLVDTFVGRIRGGLGVVAAITCAIIGAISGSGFTGVAAIGPILIPRMVEKGYPRGYAAALITDSSILGLLIPPSVIMIVFGWVTETSILACFLATVFPGLLIMALFSIINLVWARRFPLVLEPKLSPPEMRKQISTRGVRALPALVMPIIILGGIYGGIVTPTEAAAVAVVYAIPVGFFIYKGLTVKSYTAIAKESAVSVGSIMLMIFFSLMLSQTYTMLRIPQAIVEGVFEITTNTTVLLIMVNLVLLFVGMIVNDITGMILVAPLLLPLVVAIGIHPIHFAAIIGVNLAVGGVTPPYASILYLGMRIGKVEFHEIVGPAMVFVLLGYMPVVLLTSFWPPLSLYLPGLMGFLG